MFTVKAGAYCPGLVTVRTTGVTDPQALGFAGPMDDFFKNELVAPTR